MEDTVTETTVLVAIDGPAGSGKSSVSRAAADRLGFGILDTGAAYRSLAWAAGETGADLDDEASMLAVMDRWSYQTTLLGDQRIGVLLNDGAEYKTYDITAAIRTPEVSGQVSRVSKHASVRVRLNEMFRQIVAESGLPGVVIEGRDITTVVAPDAPVRILMTASPEVRATRRAGELPGMSHEQVLADINARDMKDAKVVDFLNPAPGVTLIDTSDMNFEQSIQAVIDTVDAARTTRSSTE
ncbi:(d)CMP kinase [Leucobacter denitrificans]|uniref:Cytidylate kinase n=1 Tax=Leucobacter denitrificans TaxID=683042 RepID=A0A7G9S472_9MICO|nr:(d)CMP kinase [Leucobacter denitrificans]QNN62647.1 (d)CMP kinase [Leucobacter denitrificans]